MNRIYPVERTKGLVFFTVHTHEMSKFCIHFSQKQYKYVGTPHSKCNLYSVTYINCKKEFVI